jgi:hypothetical protein
MDETNVGWPEVNQVLFIPLGRIRLALSFQKSVPLARCRLKVAVKSKSLEREFEAFMSGSRRCRLTSADAWRCSASRRLP